MHSFPLLTIAKTLRKGHTSSEFFFKKTSVLYRGYFQNHHQLCPSFLTFSKNFISSLLLSQKHPEKVTPFRNFFQKKRYPLPGVFPKRHTSVLPLSEKIRKNLHLTTDYQDCHPILLHPFSTFLQKSITYYRGYIQNDTPLCCCFQKKFPKKHHLPPLTVAIPPLFCYTLFQLFFKNFCLSTADYHFFAPKRSHPFPEFFQKRCYSLHQ